MTLQKFNIEHNDYGTKTCTHTGVVFDLVEDRGGAAEGLKPVLSYGGRHLIRRRCQATTKIERLDAAIAETRRIKRAARLPLPPQLAIVSPAADNVVQLESVLAVPAPPRCRAAGGSNGRR